MKKLSSGEEEHMNCHEEAIQWWRDLSYIDRSLNGLDLDNGQRAQCCLTEKLTVKMSLILTVYPCVYQTTVGFTACTRPGTDRSTGIITIYPTEAGGACVLNE